MKRLNVSMKDAVYGVTYKSVEVPNLGRLVLEECIIAGVQG